MDLALSDSVLTMLPRPLSADPPLYQNMASCFRPLSLMPNPRPPAARSPDPSRAWLDCSKVQLHMDSYDVPRSQSKEEVFSAGASSSPITSRLLHPSEKEAKMLDDTVAFLNRCLFFYPDFSMEEARRRLAPCKTGAFLLRPSSDLNFILSLSVKTWRGTTSVRVAFKEAQFFLDSDPSVIHRLPKFDSLPKLLAFFQRLSKSSNRKHVFFVEACGRKDTPIELTVPCVKETGSLKHLCRVAVHRALKGQAAHQLPGASTRMMEYLQEYPHSI